MKVSSVFLLIFSFSAGCSQNVWADSMREREAYAQKEAEKMLDTETIRSPYYAKILYRSLNEGNEKDNQNKQEIMTVLQQSMGYTPEEFKELTDNFEKNPPIKYTKSKLSPEQIKENPINVFYQLSIQKELNPAFFKTESANLKKNNSQTALLPQSSSQKEIQQNSSSVIRLKTITSSEHRLGKKSFKINPDQFY